MIRHFLLSLLSILILVSFSGCSCKQSELEAYAKANPVMEYVKVPVKCIVPDTNCTVDQNGSNTEVIIDLLECIVDLKRANEVCK